MKICLCNCTISLLNSSVDCFAKNPFNVSYEFKSKAYALQIAFAFIFYT